MSLIKSIQASHCENNNYLTPSDEKPEPQTMNSQGQPQSQPQPNMASLQQAHMPISRNCTSMSETFSTQSGPANCSHPPQPKDLSLPAANKNELVSRGLGSFWAEMIDAIKIKEQKGDEKWWVNPDLKPEVWDMHARPSSIAFPTSDPRSAHLPRSYPSGNCLPVTTADFYQAQLAQDVLRMIPPESPSCQPVIASNSMNNGSTFQLPNVGSNNRVPCECPNCKANILSGGGVSNNDNSNRNHSGSSSSSSSNNNNNNNNNSSSCSRQTTTATNTNTATTNNNTTTTNNTNTNTNVNNTASESTGCNSGTNKPPGKLHNCHIPGCTRVFRKSWRLKAHVRSHTGERPYQCQWPTCTRRFTRSDKLHRHMANHTEERKFSCFVCHRRFVRSDCLILHLKNHEIVVDNKTISCSDLVKQDIGGGGDGNIDLESAGNMLAMLTGGTATVLPAPSLMKFKVYPCPYAGCDKMFKTTWHLKAHVRSHTGEKPFICGWPMCGKRFTRSDKLNRHMNTHTDGKQFPCPLCNKRFVRSDYINHHIRVQHGKNPSDYSFPTPKNLPNDSNNEDNNNGNSENAVFNHTAGQSQPPAFPHLANCSLPRPVPPQHHQTMTQSENGTGENKTHQNLMQSILCEQSKVPCPAEHCPANHCPDGQCEAGHCPIAPPSDFGRPTKNYSCSMDGCDKVFKDSWHLKSHMRSHTGEKPYACNWPLCGKRFRNSWHLNVHVRSHTGEKPYACNWPLCGKRFARSDKLYRHGRKHTERKSASLSTVPEAFCAQ